MNDKGDFDRAVDRWLDDGSDATPSEVIDAVLLAVRSTPQEADFRVPWRRTPIVNRIVGFGFSFAAAVVVVIIVAQLFGSPGNVGSGDPTPTIKAAPDGSLGLSRFTSTMHGISIDYPSGWQIRPATEPWTGGALSFDSPAADVIFDPMLGERRYVVLASRSGRPSPFDEQTDQFDLIDESGVCGDAEGGGGASPRVDGASTWHWHCDSAHTAAVTTDDRRYLIALVGSGDGAEAGDTYDFDAALETVDLRPDDAR